MERRSVTECVECFTAPRITRSDEDYFRHCRVTFIGMMRVSVITALKNCLTAWKMANMS